MSGNLQISDAFSLVDSRKNDVFSTKDNIILLTFDDNYLDQSINLIHSILRYHPNGVSFVCVCPKLKETSVAELLKIQAGIQLLSYDFSLDLEMHRWSSSAILRLFCPWFLDVDIHKVLYMDSDILCTGSLQDLFDADIPYVGMCSEISGNTAATREYLREYCPVETYCNSGVTLFNLDNLRRDYSFGQIMDALTEVNGKVIYLDQDFLNIYFRGKILVLNPFRYNLQIYELNNTPFYDEALELCRLIHFSVGKPWKYKTHLYLIRLYLKHSSYEPMIKKVKATYIKSLLYSPIRQVRHMLSPLKQAWLKRNA